MTAPVTSITRRRQIRIVGADPILPGWMAWADEADDEDEQERRGWPVAQSAFAAGWLRGERQGFRWGYQQALREMAVTTEQAEHAVRVAAFPEQMGVGC